VLSGGSAARIQGADKATLELAGATLLDHVLAALGTVEDVVVVGERVPVGRPVTFLREDPPMGGPAAGILAGLDGFSRAPAQVVVLAVDMPLVTEATVRRLVQAAVDLDGALLVDGEGRRQYLCAAYRTAALRSAAPAPAEQHGLSVRRLVSGLRLAEVVAVGGEAQDVDTWADLRTVRARMEE
jgi:molybdopterin-guanine dinucleotide biosynthesis protein A